jgi:hypothetical protein
MARGAVMITYAEIFGKEPLISDLQTILSKFRRIEITSLLAKINCLLGTWKNKPDFELDAWLCDQLMPRHKSALDGIRRKSPEQRIVFSRLPLLYAIKQALVGSDSGSAMPNTPSALEEIGVAVLMANDLVLPGRPERSDSTLAKLTNLSGRRRRAVRRWPPSATQTARAVFPHAAFTKTHD